MGWIWLNFTWYRYQTGNICTNKNIHCPKLSDIYEFSVVLIVLYNLGTSHTCAVPTICNFSVPIIVIFQLCLYIYCHIQIHTLHYISMSVLTVVHTFCFISHVFKIKCYSILACLSLPQRHTHCIILINPNYSQDRKTPRRYYKYLKLILYFSHPLVL